ncbi:serine hydrolase [Halalkalibacillus halophilus]|uniref:serine hydrolase n=1 Tax=Halalkalibacillus halophilus TaxID=392827 RepID=UPI000404BE52|nr:serine hydrolase [Halalkalibacillus halophilus]
MRERVMKKSIMMLMTVGLLIGFIVSIPIHTLAQPEDIEAESAILVDADTGEILYSTNADISLPPASMTKVMTEYLVLEAVEEGDISWDTTTEISEYAFSISADNTFSGVGLRMDTEYTVKELYDAMAIYSDNATSIALAELIAGSEGEFVQMMNEKAEELGMQEYEFVNSTGLANSHLGDQYPEGTDPEADNLLSARSMALLAYHLVNDFPHALDVSSVPTQEFEGHEMINYNWMLPGLPGNLEAFAYEGMDGLKTGWTSLAGYAFAGTAERDDTRLISVVMRTESVEARFNETRKLMDYGFDNFEKATLYEAGYQHEGEETLPVAKGKQEEVSIATTEPIERFIYSGDEENFSVSYEMDEELLNEDGKIEAAVEEGTEVGRMVLNYDGDHDYGNILGEDAEQQSVTIETTEAVERSNWFMLILQAIGDFFSGLFDSIKGIFV